MARNQGLARAGERNLWERVAHPYPSRTCCALAAQEMQVGIELSKP